MNYHLNNTSLFAPLIPACDAIAVAHGVPTVPSYELEDTIFRALPYSWDIGDTAATLHSHIDSTTLAVQELFIFAPNQAPGVPTTTLP